MNTKQYKFLWATIQIFLFFVPILISIVITPLEISYDKEYNANVPQRIFAENNKMTDFKEAVVAEYDSQGTYVTKKWLLKNPEVYYYKNIMGGIIVGMILQIGNILWLMEYDYF